MSAGRKKAKTIFPLTLGAESLFIQYMMTKHTEHDAPSSKAERQAKLLEIVRSEIIATQTELVTRLEQAGINCTQVSISRDIRDLGLAKRNGRYVVADEKSDTPDLKELARTVGGFIQSIEPVGENLVVVHTLSGTAHSVALLLDKVDWQGIVGTVAGDDTIFVAVHSSDAGRKTVKNLRKFM